MRLEACRHHEAERPSSEDGLDNVSVNVGQAKISTLETEGQLCVVEAEQMQDRGVEIVDVHGVLNRIEPKFIGATMHMAFLQTATCHPYAEGPIVVIASIVATLDHRCPSKFATPNNKRIIQHAQTLEVFDQGGAGFIRGVRIVLNVCR
jgi:hypothetical protein